MEVGQPSDLDFYPVSMTLVEFHSIKTQLEQLATQREVEDTTGQLATEEIEGDERLKVQLGYVRDQFSEGFEVGSGLETLGDDTIVPPGVN